MSSRQLRLVSIACLLALVLGLGGYFGWRVLADQNDDQQASPTIAAQQVPSGTPTTGSKTETPVSLPTNTAPATPTKVETPVSLPTNTPTTMPTEEPTDTPTLAPTEIPTEVPTATPTPKPADLTISWQLVNADNDDQPLGAQQVVAIVAFNGSDAPLYLQPNQDGRVEYTQADAPQIDQFGLLVLWPLGDEGLNPTLLPFKLDGNHLVLLNPRHSSLDPLGNQDQLRLSGDSRSSDHSEVLQAGCKPADCADMMVRLSGQVGPEEEIDCQSQALVTADDGLYQATYRAANGLSIAVTTIGPGVDLGKGWVCQAGDQTFWVTRYGSLVWRYADIAAAQQSQEGVQPADTTTASDGGQADQGSGGDSSGDCGDCNQPQQPIEPPPSDGGSEGSDGGCENCSPPIVPVNTPTPAPANDPTPTPVF